MDKRRDRISLWRLTLVLAAPMIAAAAYVHYLLPQRREALGPVYLIVVAAIGVGVGWLQALLASVVVAAERALSVEPVGPLGTDDPRDLEYLVVFIAVAYAAVVAAGHALAVEKGGLTGRSNPRDLEFLVVFMVLAFAVSLVSSMRRRQLERTNKRLEKEMADRMRAERELAAHRDHLQTQARLLDLANDAIVAFGVTAATILYWNEGAEKLYGWSKEEALGKPVHSLLKTIFPKPLPEIERELTEQGVWKGELIQTKLDGTQVNVSSQWTLQQAEGAQTFAVLEINRDITEKKKAEQEFQESYAELASRVKERTAQLAEANEELRKHIANKELVAQRLRKSERSLRQLSTQLMRAEEEERRLLGRELHDSVGQYLAALMINLDLLRLQVSHKDDAAESRCAECFKIADECVTEIRTLSYLMYPPLLDDYGLHQAIPFYVKGFEERSGIATSVELPSEVGRLPRDLELAVFRILQESLTNIQRHSKATAASVRLLMTDGRVTLEVKDNGQGMPTGIRGGHDGSAASTGVGLRGMKERALHLGGELVVGSSANGTSVTVTLPCQETRPAGAAGIIPQQI